MIQKTAEMKKLIDEYEKPGSRLVVFYGRNGCKKEEYIANFQKGKEHFYYRARELSAYEQKKQLIKEVEKWYSLQLEQQDYDSCFSVMQSRSHSKYVIVIDEFEHLVKKDLEFMESLIKRKKLTDSKSEVFIVLCSSSFVWVEHKMETVLGNFFPNIDAFLKISEMNFLDIVRAFPENSVSECVQMYGILGGIPAYLECWDTKKNIKENICQMILSKEGRLFSKAEEYLRAELRELSVYNTILTAIARGHRKLNELHQYTGYSRAKISVYMKHLMEFDVIEKVVSFETGGWENAQKGVYQIKNTFLNFWYKFVFPYSSDLYVYTPEEFYEKHIAEELEEYFNRYFIQVCMEYMELLNQVHKLPLQIHKIGTWIGKQGTIDIIAQNFVRENVVGICNWSKESMTYDRYEELGALMKQARISAKHYFLFSAKAFDDALIKKASEQKNITLIDMTEL